MIKRSVPKGGMFHVKQRRTMPELTTTAFWSRFAAAYNRDAPRFFSLGHCRLWCARELGRRFDARPGEPLKSWGKAF